MVILLCCFLDITATRFYFLRGTETLETIELTFKISYLLHEILINGFESFYLDFIFALELR